MKMTKMKHITIILLLFFYLPLSAQVKISENTGTATEPASYSLLEVEGEKGGIRLPRMTSSEMTTLGTALSLNSEGNGLLVYNITDNKLMFWNGSNWIALGAVTYTTINGLSETSSPKAFELGGTLSDSVSINLSGYNLNFAQSTGAEFLTGGLSIKNDAVNNTPTRDFIVNTDALKVNVPARNITINGETDINEGLLTVNSTAVGIDGTLQYKDGTQEEGFILASDNSGNASWQGLRPFGTIARGQLNEDQYDITGSALTTKSLALTPGQWIILAKATIWAFGRTSPMYYWMELREVGTSDYDKFYMKTGMNPELVTSTTEVVYCTPNLAYFVNLTAPKNFEINITTSNSGTGNAGMMRTTTSFGGSYFYAVRVDAPE